MKLQWNSFVNLLTLVVFAHAQPGFISIDCGIAEDSPYNDTTTGIFYNSDAQFIGTGVDRSIPKPQVDPRLRQLYNNIKSFPNGSRNCYNLSEITKGNKYLIRAYFLYGNYDGKNSTPEFDLYFGVNRWTTISFSDPNESFYKEIITSSMYSPANESQSLLRTLGSDVGGFTDNPKNIRYPDDPFDLIWSPTEDENYWSPFNTSHKVMNPDEAFQPPSVVMRTAIRPVDDSNELYCYWTANDSSLQFHVYMYFAELEQLDSNMTREFTVCCGSDSCFDGPISPEYLVTYTLPTDQPLSGQHEYSCSFKKTPNSTLPPILNAIEVFTILQHNSTPTRDQDVEAILDIKAAYQVKKNWMGDPCVPKNYSWQGLKCDYTLSHAPKILSLNLSSAGLNGGIAASLANLNSIHSLDLSWNNLTGPVPKFSRRLAIPVIIFGACDHFRNLSGNKLSGSVPSNLLEKSKKGSLKLSVDDNPDLCVSDSCSKDSNKQKIIILVVAPLAFVVILLILLIILWRFKWRKQDPVVMANKSGLFSSENRRFTYAEIINMTNNFERSIGKGGFGTVYHGQMPDGTQVAVKMLSLQSVKLLSHMRQGSDEFQNEVQLLMRVHHRNLVPFIGYCQEGDGMALIYEYMAQGNLGSHLLGTNSNTKALNWRQRLRIALDIAQGLEYLHTGCKPAIIHRDMKTTNILLNERFEAKIGDFGLSKVFFKDDEQAHVSTLVKGTPGYLDPEYCHSNNLTQKSDVYGFGVVLLELITGQPPIIRSNTNYEKKNLVDWASPIIATRDMQAVLDPRLEGDYDANSLSKVAEIALACTSPTSVERPTMTDIVAVLKDCLGTETPAEISCSLEIEQVESTPTSSFSSQPLPR
ncbi:putative LRR receptor-like serine/threonine-protein kinase [Cinnamomum micranthum f. kanehirae]|uniref:Putative LRR receptor-like serine/threonine-protein kinase n=1 Tax=Cinnamomum micranthum f. kanehirae TaxID=337451 RepID=A0A443NI47_9MAGN|nr:putative LRR receptor-like serine/threonine-protein kinase [Cinnamomum micranthum f. kanehirae]